MRSNEIGLMTGGKRIVEQEVKLKEEERVCMKLREAKRLRKRERVAEAKIAEEHGEKTVKWSHWTPHY
jgi:hypothetical protein